MTCPKSPQSPDRIGCYCVNVWHLSENNKHLIQVMEVPCEHASPPAWGPPRAGLHLSISPVDPCPREAGSVGLALGDLAAPLIFSPRVQKGWRGDRSL